MMLDQIKAEFLDLTDAQKAQTLTRFFKTDKGGYGEGDQFLGIKVPEQRKLAGKYKQLPLPDVIKLLTSSIHEHRLTALFILIYQFQKVDPLGQKEIVDLYLKYKEFVNNWDLVDSSADKILGPYYFDHPQEKKILFKLAKSDSVWDRRIAIMTTFYFIKQKNYADTLQLAEILLNDPHDLIHKAVGWMLREIGNRDQPTEEIFLQKHYRQMPRTMLRYAIEKFSNEKRAYYLKR